MRMMPGVIAGLLLQAAGNGAISNKNASMPVVDSIAVWDPAKGELRVSLLPFKIQNRHLAKIQKDKTMFVVLDENTPDAKKWPDRCPGAEVSLLLDAKDLSKGPAAIKSYQMWIYGLEKKNDTENINTTDEDSVRKEFSKLSVKVDAKGTGTFEMEFSRTSALTGFSTWKVSVKGSVLAPAK